MSVRSYVYFMGENTGILIAYHIFETDAKKDKIYDIKPSCYLTGMSLKVDWCNEKSKC